MIEKALDQLSSQGSQSKQDSAAGSGAATPTVGEDGEPSKVKVKEMPTWTGVTATKSAKSQALEAMKALIAWQPIPVTRARMRLRISCPQNILKQPTKSVAPPKKDTTGADEEDTGGKKAGQTVKERILSYVEEIEQEEHGGSGGAEWEIVCFVEPGAFKPLGEFVGGETKGRGRVEVLDMAVVHEDKD